MLPFLLACLLGIACVPPDAPAGVVIEPSVVDFGRLASGEARTGRFVVRNTGSAPVKVNSAFPSCKCTAVTDLAGREIPPGGSVELSATMEACAGREGREDLRGAGGGLAAHGRQDEGRGHLAGAARARVRGCAAGPSEGERATGLDRWPPLPRAGPGRASSRRRPGGSPHGTRGRVGPDHASRGRTSPVDAGPDRPSGGAPGAAPGSSRVHRGALRPGCGAAWVVPARERGAVRTREARSVRAAHADPGERHAARQAQARRLGSGAVGQVAGSPREGGTGEVGASRRLGGGDAGPDLPEPGERSGLPARGHSNGPG
ncbi:MAG: DUF1573 domain-containing protein [Planctomycetes bacterium]|nr:DUF1573 domain-containing protein [Planctomycetota bacterium]